MASCSSLTSIRTSDVPEYLRRSELYLSFSSTEDEEEISVPIDCLKLNPTVTNALELEHLLKTIRFWIVNDIPKELVHFLLTPLYKNTRHVLERFEHTIEFPWLHIFREIRTVRRKAAVAICAKHGSVILLDYFVKSGVSVNMFAVRIAAQNGHTECLAYIQKELVRKGRQFPFATISCLPLIEKGNLECVKFIVSHGHDVTETMCICAAEWAHPACLQYLLNASHITSGRITLAAAEAGSLLCLQYAVEHDCPVGQEAWSAAVAKVECLRFLLTRFPEYVLTDDLLLEACRISCVASFYLLQEHGCPYHMDMVYSAAKGGSMEILWLLDDLGFDCWIPSTMAAAAGAGHLYLIEILNEMGCEWDDSAPTVALMERQAVCLEYLIRHRAVPTGDAFEWILTQTTSAECFRVVTERKAELAKLAAILEAEKASLAAEAGPELSVEAEGDVAAELGEDGVAAEEAGELIGHEVFYEE